MFRSEPRGGSRTLIFDADDTLWEMSMVFERVIDDYLDWLAHPTLDRTELRGILVDIERASVQVHGYGTTGFLHSLAACFERLSERPASPAERDQIDTLAAALILHKVELMPGVSAALEQLGRRHTLHLLTKGDQDEQQRKIDASGLAHRFASISIVPEKKVSTYVELSERLSLDVASTWMIGNSPASDILPARGAGMNAVLIPNQHTWVLEQGEIDPADDRILILDTFPDLLHHF